MPRSGATPIERRLLATASGFVHLRWRSGGGGGVPLVLLHPSPYSGRFFEPLLAHLPRGRALAIPDRLGFGASDPLHEGARFGDVAAATAAALEAVSIDHFDVLGVLTGSAEAIELALSVPQRVRRLLLVEVPLMSDADWASWPSFVRTTPALAADGSHLKQSWDFFAQATLEGGARELTGWRLEQVNEAVVDEQAAGPGWRHLYPALRDHPLEQNLGRVRQPTLIFRTASPIAAQTRRAIDALPLAGVVDYGDVETLELLRARPQLLARKIEEFAGA